MHEAAHHDVKSTSPVEVTRCLPSLLTFDITWSGGLRRDWDKHYPLIDIPYERCHDESAQNMAHLYEKGTEPYAFVIN